MSAIPEILRGRLRVSETPLPAKPEDAIGQAVDIFSQNFSTQGTQLEVANPFGRWVPTTRDDAQANVGEWLDCLFANSRRLDGCRSVGRIRVGVYRSLFNPRSRTMVISAKESVRLGDGTPSHAWGEWGMTQVKGEHHNDARLRIRQRT